MNKRRVVITGLGAVTGFGFDWQAMWQDMLDARHCIRPWQPEGIEGQQFPVRFAAAVDPALAPSRFSDHQSWHMPLEKRTRFGWIAAKQAVDDSGLSAAELQHAAVLTASGAPQHMLSDMQLALSSTSPHTAAWQHLMARQSELAPDGALRQSSDRLARLIANDAGCCGPVINISSACAGAAQAIGNAFHMVRRGEVAVAIAGGADSVLNLGTMSALHLLGAASTEQRWGEELCRPFDSHRSGLVAGEGGGFLILESLEHAQRRGATPYAEILGYGSSSDGYKLTAPEPNGRGAVLAMQGALRDAALPAQTVDLVNAHGTSTPLNDVAETRAIKQVFAPHQHFRQLAVCANKSQFGHLIAAAGALEIMVSALSCRDDRIPPTLNLHQPDPECDLDYCANQAASRKVDIALSNSFGFGGLNASLIVGKFRESSA